MYYPVEQYARKNMDNRDRKKWLILDPLKCQIQNTGWIFILLVVYSYQIRVILSSGAFYKSYFPPRFKPDPADTATMFHTWLEAEICTLLATSCLVPFSVTVLTLFRSFLLFADLLQPINMDFSSFSHRKLYRFQFFHQGKFWRLWKS